MKASFIFKFLLPTIIAIALIILSFSCNQPQTLDTFITGKWNALAVPNKIRYGVTNVKIEIGGTSYLFEAYTYTGEYKQYGRYSLDNKIITISHSFSNNLDSMIQRNSSVYYVAWAMDLMIWADTTNTNSTFVWKRN